MRVVEERARGEIDVEGVYDRPPKEPDAQLIDIFTDETNFKEGKLTLL